VLVHGDRVYSWCERTSVKARNVARTGVATMTGYKGHAFVMVRGPARLIEKGQENYEDIARGFLDKYEREESYGNDTLIEITPERVSSDRVD
jgi:hypothetical protein